MKIDYIKVLIGETFTNYRQFLIYKEKRYSLSNQERIRIYITWRARQDCSLSSILFNLYSDDAMRHWILGWEIYMIQDKVPTLFANDQVLLT